MTAPENPHAPVLRASDAERDQVAVRLGEAVGEGRLTLAEFSDRVAAVHAARTRAELEPLTADLPAPAAVAPGGTGTAWHISPIGGVHRSGRWRLPARTVSVGVIGGMDLDLTQAEFASREVRILRVGVVGSVTIRVPAGVRVEVGGFSLIGGHSIELPEPAPGAPTLRLTLFGVVGGVSVRVSG